MKNPCLRAGVLSYARAACSARRLASELLAQPSPRSRSPIALVLRRNVSVVGVDARDAAGRRPAFEQHIEVADRREVILLPVDEQHRHFEVLEQPVVLQRPAQELLALLLFGERFAL